MAQRRSLTYSTVADISDDIRQLRRGYEKSGKWSLEEISCHLDRGLNSLLQSGPEAPNTPQQDAMHARLETLIASGGMPTGLPMPEGLAPPTDCSEQAVDDFLATLDKFSQFKTPVVFHSRFGRLTNDELRRFVLIHSAHHLSHLVPTSRTT